MVFNAVSEMFAGKIQVNRSSVILQPKIKLEYKEVRTEKGWLGEREFDTPKEIDFGAQTMPEDIANTIQAKTGLQPVKSLEDTSVVDKSQHSSNPDGSSIIENEREGEEVGETIEKEEDDLSEKIEELSERAGLNDTPEPDFDN